MQWSTEHPVPWLLTLIAGMLPAACTNEGPQRISDSGFGAYEVSIAVQPHRIAVAWYDTRDGNAEIYLRLLDGQGKPLGSEHRLTDDEEDSYEVDIDAAGDAFAVAWYDKDTAGALRAKLGLWEPAAGFLWRTDLSPPGIESRNPVVRVRDGAIFCAWIEQDDGGGESVRAAWWEAGGRRAASPVTIGDVAPTTWNLNAALDSRGRAYVVFDAEVDTAAEELYLARLDGSSTSLLRLTDDDGQRSKYPDIAITGQRAALTWFDERDGNREVYLFAGTLADLDPTMEPRARRITYTQGESIGAYVAWNDETIGLAWSDSVDGPRDVFFQPFDEQGQPRRAIKRVTRTSTRSSIPAIRRWQSGFAIAWNEVAPSPAGVHDPVTRSEVDFVLLP